MTDSRVALAIREAEAVQTAETPIWNIQTAEETVVRVERGETQEEKS